MTTSPTRRMSPPPVYEFSRSTPQYHTTLTPYLQLPHLLSLTWLAYPILSLLFIAVRLQLSLASSQDAVASAKGDLLAACQAAERAATATASSIKSYVRRTAYTAATASQAGAARGNYPVPSTD